MRIGQRVATGIYYQGENSYAIKVSIGKRKKNGQYDIHTETFHGSEREAIIRRAKLITEIAEGRLKPPEKKLTLGGYFERWLKDLDHRVSLGGIRQTTAKWYKETLTRYFAPCWGILLSKLSPQHIERVYAALLSGGMSPATIQGIHKALKATFKDGKRLNVQMPDIIDLIQVPKAPRIQRAALEPDQAQALLAAAENDQVSHALIMMLLNTGMRIGEALALRWEDIDFKTEVITISRTLIKAGTKPQFGPHKTANSTGPRLIKAPLMLMKCLKRLKVHQAQVRLEVGKFWQDYGLMFTGQDGRPIDRHNFGQRKFKALLKAAGLPDIRVHDLRHSAASLLLSNGVPIQIVKEILGHTEIGTTVNIYGHISLAAQGEAMKIMERLLRKKEGLD